MENNAEVSLNVSSEIIKPIIEKKIQAAIVEALGGSGELIEKAIELALRSKVSSEGKISNYSYENKHDFIEIVCKQTIQEVTKDAMKEWASENKKTIKAKLLKTIKLKQSTIAEQMFESFLRNVESGYWVDVNLSLRKLDS